MARGTLVLVLFAVAVVGQALTPSTFLTTVDRARLRSVFEQAQPFPDAAAAHYSILGLKLLGVAVQNEQDVCRKVTSLVVSGDVASLFHASTAAKGLSNCKLAAGDAQKTLTGAITDGAAVQDIFHAFFALKNYGLAVDNAKVSKTLLEALKKDDSPLSYSYAFQVAAALPSGETSKFFDSIEDVVAQADEVDDKYLQFEGGLSVTASVIDGAYKLAEAAKKAPMISQDKVLKFTNYFLSRKHVHQLKSAYHFVSVIQTLTSNQFYIPVAVSLASSVSVSQASPSVQIQVTNLMGGSMGKLTVTADSARNLASDAIVLSKKTLTPSKTDESVYELNFMDNKPAHGFYKLTLSVAPQKADSRLIGTTGAVVEVKVTTQVSLENIEIGVVDKDQFSLTKPTKLQYPSKAASVLEADFHQKLLMKFQLREKGSSAGISAHQAFVKLTNLKTKQEIIFVTEPDSSKTNKFDLTVAAKAKEFGYVSGRYSMELIIGDAVIENPISWAMADVDLTFPAPPSPPAQKVDAYSKRPEIKHMFREPEKRPPKVISTIFTVLVLVPLLILAVCWIKIGANVSNFPMSASALGFHISLGAIFGLYYCYWTQLNMFTTLRYLGILAVPTFIFGNRLLSGIAARRKGEK